ncbi:MAG: hypothetical protein V4484_08160 [Pseudomonadota bacterium]
MRRKWVFAGLGLVGWISTISAANMLLAPATGAATVMQMEASNSSYLASMFVVAGAPMATVVITGLFVLALFLISRSPK